MQSRPPHGPWLGAQVEDRHSCGPMTKQRHRGAVRRVREVTIARRSRTICSRCSTHHLLDPVLTMGQARSRDEPQISDTPRLRS